MKLLVPRIICLMFFLFFNNSIFASEFHESKSKINIITSIKPIHSLVANITKDLFEPKVIFKSNQKLRKEDYFNLLKKSSEFINLIVWIGPCYESNLIKTIRDFSNIKNIRILTLSNDNRITFFKKRNGDLWINKDSICSCSHNIDHYEKSELDGHIWLNPNNAMTIVEIISEYLIKMDPKNKQKYIINTNNIKNRLNKLKFNISKKISLIKNNKYIVTHDSYQYWDAFTGLEAIGAIQYNSSLGICAKDFLLLKNTIRNLKKNFGGICLFSDINFHFLKKENNFGSLINDEGIHIVSVDPLGTHLECSSELYFDMMNKLCDTMSSSLNLKH